jgi:hypothetical protein
MIKVGIEADEELNATTPLKRLLMQTAGIVSTYVYGGKAICPLCGLKVITSVHVSAAREEDDDDSD